MSKSYYLYVILYTLRFSVTVVKASTSSPSSHCHSSPSFSASSPPPSSSAVVLVEVVVDVVVVMSAASPPSPIVACVSISVLTSSRLAASATGKDI